MLLCGVGIFSKDIIWFFLVVFVPLVNEVCWGAAGTPTLSLNVAGSLFVISSLPPTPPLGLEIFAKYLVLLS